MSASADTIEKIKKLLRLARSANPHEAQLAMQRALALAEEHRVAIEGLNPDDCAREKATTHRETEILSRRTYDQRYAFAVCRRFFRVTTVDIQCVRMVDGWPRDGWKTAIVGTKSDIEIALYVHGYLTQHFAFCWRKFRGRFRNRQAYVHGMYLGICARLAENAPAPTGREIVLAEQDAYIATVYGETTKTPLAQPDHEARGAAWAGFLQGQKTEIRPALNSVDTVPLALK